MPPAPARSAARPAGEAEPRVVERLARLGIDVGGSQPWDPQVRDERFYRRVWEAGELGLSQSYADGWWDCDRLDEMLARLLRAGSEEPRGRRPAASAAAPAQGAGLAPRGGGRGLFDGAETAYQVSGELFRAVLGSSLSYSCARWQDAATLEQAQAGKWESICRQLRLRPGMRVLDVGCGSGAFALHAARRHGVAVTGVTISRRELEAARAACAGLPVDVQLRDFREISGTYDAIVSVEAFEQFAADGHQAYFEVAARSLAPGGLMLLQTVGQTASPKRSYDPEREFPSLARIALASEPWFVVEEVHNLGADYERTYLAWCQNLAAAWPGLRGGFDDRFHRMARYYLLSFAASFRARRIHLWQIVFSHRGDPPRPG